MNSQEQTPRLLDQVRNVMRLHHYSIHTERSYTDWIKRYIHFHHMRRREDLANGESKIVKGSAYSDSRRLTKRTTICKGNPKARKVSRWSAGA